jgi:hypothetical protein
MVTYEGIATHKRIDETYRYQITVPYEVVSRRLGVTTDIVNKSGQLPPGFMAVHPADRVYEALMAA